MGLLSKLLGPSVNDPQVREYTELARRDAQNVPAQPGETRALQRLERNLPREVRAEIDRRVGL